MCYQNHTYTYDELDRSRYNDLLMTIVHNRFKPEIVKSHNPLLVEACEILMENMADCVNRFPQQRFGQIVHNYMDNAVADCEQGDVVLGMFRSFVFGFVEDTDIFFEESRVTYENLLKRLSEESVKKTEYEYRHVPFLHPKNESGVFWDLVRKYEKFGTLYIGVDFDNTLLPYEQREFYNEDGEQVVSTGFLDVVSLLRWCKLLGMKLCLWSLPDSDENLDWKVEWCGEHGIAMDYVNESPLLSGLTEKYGKPHFNLLLDDVAGLESSYSVLYNLCEYIDGKRS